VCDDNMGVAVVVSAEHLCTCVRGVKHNSIMKTAKLSGVFRDDKNQARHEFYNFIKTL
jgi:GTP cyclohydrolase I